VQINIPDLEKTYPYADVGDGITSGLEATMRGGACILWNQSPSAPGSVWAIVRIDGLPAASSSTDQLNFDCYFRHRSHFTDPIIVDPNDWRGRLLLVGGAYGPVDGNPNPGWVSIHNLRLRTPINPATDVLLLRQGSANSLLQFRVDRTSGQLYLYSEAWNSVNTSRPGRCRTSRRWPSGWRPCGLPPRRPRPKSSRSEREGDMTW
jgi:hypothetical protein